MAERAFSFKTRAALEAQVLDDGLIGQWRRVLRIRGPENCNNIDIDRSGDVH